MKQFLVSEQGLLIEAYLGIALLYYLFGFEITVLGALGFIAAKVYHISLNKK